MRAWLDSQRDWLTAERLPAYAPELNPVEGLRSDLVLAAAGLTLVRRARTLVRSVPATAVAPSRSQSD